MSTAAPDQSLAVQPTTAEEEYAVQAVASGKADEGQQVLAISVILKKLSRAYDLSYIPGKPHESAFLAGRSFVGMNLTRIINQKPK